MAADSTRHTNEIIEAGGGVQTLNEPVEVIFSSGGDINMTMKNPNLSQFERMVEQLDGLAMELQRMFKNKTYEYAKDSDIFGTIKGVAELNKITPSKACMVLCSKHFISLLRDIDTLSLSQIGEKMIDLHLYLEYARFLKDED